MAQLGLKAELQALLYSKLYLTYVKISKPFLQVPPLLEGLEEAVKRIKPDSSPGPGDLPLGFYETFWAELRGFFLKLVHNLFRTPD